eukprot:1149051-Pelagomonas_calceolata.AAC.2
MMAYTAEFYRGVGRAFEDKCLNQVCGTPSQKPSTDALEYWFSSLGFHFPVSSDMDVTLEFNVKKRSIPDQSTEKDVSKP